jgi:hypothetical protein
LAAVHEGVNEIRVEKFDGRSEIYGGLSLRTAGNRADTSAGMRSEFHAAVFSLKPSISLPPKSESDDGGIR